MDKIVIYDTETTNSTIWGSIIEVGAVVVDKNLKEIGKLNIRGRMPEGRIRGRGRWHIRPIGRATATTGSEATE